MMDIEDIQSDLQALRKLYGLLKSDEYSLQYENYEVLDHKARLLLRNLLDAAAERVFKAHSEIVAALHGSFDTACSTQQEQSKEMMKLQPPPVLTNVPNNFVSAAQSTSKDLRTQKAVLGKDEWGPTEPASQVVSSEQYGLKIFSSQPEVRKKRCRVCQRSKAKQLKSSDEPKPMDWVTSNPDRSIGVLHQLNKPFQFGQGDVLEKRLMSSHKALQTDNFTETQGRIGSFEFQSNRSEIGHSLCSSNKPAVAIGGSGAVQGLAAEVVRKAEEADRISKEASFKIQQIESRISDLQVAAKPASPLQIQFGAHYEQCESMSSSDLGAESASSMLQSRSRLVTRNELSQVGRFVAGRNDLKIRPVSEKVWEPTQWHQVPYQFGETKMSNQVISRNSELLPPTAAMRSRTTGQNGGRNKGMNFEYDRLSEMGKHSEEYKLPRQNDNGVPEKNVRAIIDRIESVSEVGSQDDDMASETNKFVQRSRVAANAKKTVTTDIIMPTKVQRWIETENFDRHQSGLKKTNGFGTVGISQPSTPSVRSKFSRLQLVDTGSELSRTRTKAETRLPNRTITRQNLLDYKPRQHRLSRSMYEDQSEKDQGSVHKKNHHFDPRRLISTSHEVSQSTGPRSRYSSSWTSQQVVSTSFSDDEGYSVSGESQTHHFPGSSTSIEGKVYSRHGREVGPKVSRSSSDSEMYSVSSRSRGYQSDTSSSNGESEDYQSSDETPTPHHKGPSYQSGGSATRRMLMDKKQQPGRLKKLKDKLAIIFHHHHHHHHHHHGHGDDDTDSGQHVVVRGGKALWKHAGKILDRSKEEAYGEEAVKKMRSADKNQRGHFHALVEGLLQHIRHSKKSKPPKGGGLGRPGNGGKKAAAKLHWWQMLRRQRGLKMPKKPSGKGRVGRKNPKLKALPKPR